MLARVQKSSIRASRPAPEFAGHDRKIKVSLAAVFGKVGATQTGSRLASKEAERHCRGGG
jgi:hypothetical protein